MSNPLVPIFDGDNPVRVIPGGVTAYSGPDAYEKTAFDALDDVCIEFSRASSVDKVYGYNAVNNMIVNVLYTRISERDFEPTFGSNTLDLIFEPNDFVNAEIIEIEIYQQIRFWVPYLDLVISGIVYQPLPQYQAARIAFIYREKLTNLQRTFTAIISKSGVFA